MAENDPAILPDDAAQPNALRAGSAGRIASLLMAAALWGFSIALGVALVSALWACFGTVLFRPLDVVEGEVLFEAQRLRQHLALYVDPLVGARDYGPVPSRYYVLYTPLWPRLLSVLPSRWAEPVARVVGGLAWYGMLGGIAYWSPVDRRRNAAVAAAWAGGSFMLSRFCASATADSVAVAVSAAAFFDCVRRERVTAAAGALFVLAAWLKPNVVGLGAGAFLYEVGAHRRRALGPLSVALATAGVLAVVSYRLSDGLWLSHLMRSTIQPMLLSRGVDQIVPRLPFLGLPHLLAAAFCWRARRLPKARLLLTVLGVSLGWTFLSMSKVGSSTNYWLEPTVAAVLAMASVPMTEVRRVAARVPIPVKATAVFCATIVLGLNAWGSVQAATGASERRGALDRVRAECGAAPTDIVLGEHPGIEMMLDGRVIETPFQMTHLLRRGLFPEDVWKRVIFSPEVRCLVTESDILERPLSDVDAQNDRFPPSIRAALEKRFVLVEKDSGVWVYRARDPAPRD